MSSPFIQAIRDHLRARNYSKRTEKTYMYWILSYIRFHDRQHPSKLSTSHIVQFLEHLVLKHNVSPSTQKTALNSIMYLYKKFLGWDSAALDLGDFIKAKKLPIVLSEHELRKVFSHLQR